MRILNAGNAREYFYRLGRVVINQPFDADINGVEANKPEARRLYMLAYPKAKV